MRLGSLDYEKAQWGVLADLGVYSISTLSYLFGPVARVYGETRCFEKRRVSDAGEEFIPSVEDNVAATLVWDDGKVATMRSIGAQESIRITAYGDLPLTVPRA